MWCVLAYCLQSASWQFKEQIMIRALFRSSPSQSAWSGQIDVPTILNHSTFRRIWHRWTPGHPSIGLRWNFNFMEEMAAFQFHFRLSEFEWSWAAKFEVCLLFPICQGSCVFVIDSNHLKQLDLCVYSTCNYSSLLFCVKEFARGSLPHDIIINLINTKI